MKATVDARPLAAAVARVAPFCSRVTSNPALTCILVEAIDGELRLTATDLEHAATTTVNAVVHEPGSVVVGGKLLGRAVGAFNSTVEITDDGTSIALTGDGADLTVRTGETSMFPRIEWPEASTPVPTETWDDLAAVAVAASPDPTRPIITAVAFTADGIYGTDTFRIHWCAPLDGVSGLVPAVALERARKALAGGVRIGTDQHSAVLTDGTTTISTRLVAGDPPAYMSEITRVEANPHVLTFDPADLIDAVETAAIIEEPAAHNGVWLTFDNGSLTVTRTNLEAGTSCATLAAQGEWTDTRTGFNARYLIEALKATGGTSIAVSDPKRPALIRGERVSAVLMPVNPVGAR